MPNDDREKRNEGSRGASQRDENTKSDRQSTTGKRMMDDDDDDQDERGSRSNKERSNR